MTWARVTSRFAALILVTVFAVAVMLAASGGRVLNRLRGVQPKPQPKVTVEDTSAAPVVVQVADPEPIELIQKYSGTIRPFERLTMAFEVSGRIKSLGKNRSGKTFDDGVPVAAGEVLAELDMRALEAQAEEAAARLGQAEDEMRRAEALRQKNPRALSDADWKKTQTNLRIAQAQVKVIAERLKEGKLVAPVAGVISKRHKSVGESVQVHQPVFEIVQVDRVLLVVGVPESQIRPILERQNKLRMQARLSPGSDDEASIKAYVDLVGRDAFSRKWQTLTGEVYLISETSDETSGLFDVEIVLENVGGLLRPGQIGVASLVTGEVTGVRVPASAAIFQDDEVYLYSIRPEGGGDPPAKLDSKGKYLAHRVNLSREQYLEQNESLILRKLDPRDRYLVVKGQHRLAPNRRVEIVGVPAAVPDARTTKSPQQVR